jgi:hypothetical protein
MIKRAISSIFRRAGYEIRRIAPPVSDALFDQPSWVIDIINRVAPFTMTPPERVAALCQAVAHICKHQIAGDIVECGVWRGGSIMAACLALLHHGHTDRNVYLFDTFEGMTPPTELDLQASNRVSASEILKRTEKDVMSVWAISSLDEVHKNIATTGYPTRRIHFIKGRVEDTIPAHAPETIAILRLDTDWYESTSHELKHLFPSLVSGGFLIIDDYGHWTGAKQAVDEFISANEPPLFLNRIDYTARLAIKR